MAELAAVAPMLAGSNLAHHVIIELLWPLLGRASRRSLYSTSHDIRSCVLGLTSQLTGQITLEATGSWSLDKELQRMSTSIIQPVVAAHIPIALHITLSQFPHLQPVVGPLNQHLLSAAEPTLHSLHLDFSMCEAVNMSVQLPQLTQHAAHVRKLGLKVTYLATLPPVTALPALTHLDLTCTGLMCMEAYRSLASFVPQLSDLHLHDRAQPWIDSCRHMFSGPAPAAPSLRHLSGIAVLSRDVWDLLSVHAPQLQSLQAESLPLPYLQHLQPQQQPVPQFKPSVTFNRLSDLEDVLHVPDSVQELHWVLDRPCTVLIGSSQRMLPRVPLQLAAARRLTSVTSGLPRDLQVSVSHYQDNAPDPATLDRLLEIAAALPSIGEFRLQGQLGSQSQLLERIHLLPQHVHSMRFSLRWPEGDCYRGEIFSAVPPCCRKVRLWLQWVDGEAEVEPWVQGIRSMLQHAPRDRTSENPLKVTVEVEVRVRRDSPVVRDVTAVLRGAQASGQFPYVQFVVQWLDEDKWPDSDEGVMHVDGAEASDDSRDRSLGSLSSVEN